MNPRWGKGSAAEDRGLPARHRSGLDLDDESAAAAKDFIKKQNDAGKPFFLSGSTYSYALFTHINHRASGRRCGGSPPIMTR